MKEQTARAFLYERWSTPEQGKGNSCDRQDGAGKTWVEAHGLSLVEPYRDKGVSAFHGKNRQGELGRLLNTIRAGDYVLVENVDRLSREGWRKAMAIVGEVLDKGALLVTLQNERVITASEFESNPGCFLPCVLDSHLANAESVKKSKRMREVWQKKKADALQGKLVRFNRLPPWLQWDKEAGKAVVNNARAATVRRVFELAATGYACPEIIRALRDTPPIYGKWNTSSLRRLLRDKAVTGALCLPGREPQAGYYPEVVKPDLFYRAGGRLGMTQQAKHRRSEGNLFAGLCYCACGGTMTTTGGQWSKLICSRTKQGVADCVDGFRGPPVKLIEKSLLEYLVCGDFEQRLLGVEAAPSQVPELQGKLADAEKLAKKFVDLIGGDPEPSPLLYHRLKDEEARAGRLRTQIDLERQKAATPALDGYRELKILLDPSLREPEMVVSHVERDELVGPVLAGWAELKREVNRRLQDPDSRSGLRRAVNQIISRIDLDPRKDGNVWRYKATLPSGEWAVVEVGKSGHWGYTALGNKELGQYYPPASQVQPS